MQSSMTHVQECALAVIAISVVAIAIAAPFVALGPSASWRAMAAGGADDARGADRCGAAGARDLVCLISFTQHR